MNSKVRLVAQVIKELRPKVFGLMKGYNYSPEQAAREAAIEHQDQLKPETREEAQRAGWF